MKILYWDRDGYTLWYKRLEMGLFRFPTDESEFKEITAADLGLVLEGIDLRTVKRPKRFVLSKKRSELSGVIVYAYSKSVTVATDDITNRKSFSPHRPRAVSCAHP